MNGKLLSAIPPESLEAYRSLPGQAIDEFVRFLNFFTKAVFFLRLESNFEKKLSSVVLPKNTFHILTYILDLWLSTDCFKVVFSEFLFHF